MTMTAAQARAEVAELMPPGKEYAKELHRLLSRGGMAKVLTHNGVLVLQNLVSRCSNSAGRWTVTVGRLAEDLCLCKRTARRKISELRGHGLIRQLPLGGMYEPRTYEIVKSAIRDFAERIYEGTARALEPLLEKARELIPWRRAPKTAPDTEVQLSVLRALHDHSGSIPEVLALVELGLTRHKLRQVACWLEKQGQIAKLGGAATTVHVLTTAGRERLGLELGDLPKDRASVLAALHSHRTPRGILRAHTLALSEHRVRGMAHYLELEGLVEVQGSDESAIYAATAAGLEVLGVAAPEPELEAPSTTAPAPEPVVLERRWGRGSKADQASRMCIEVWGQGFAALVRHTRGRAVRLWSAMGKPHPDEWRQQLELAKLGFNGCRHEEWAHVRRDLKRTAFWSTRTWRARIDRVVLEGLYDAASSSSDERQGSEELEGAAVPIQPGWAFEVEMSDELIACKRWVLDAAKHGILDVVWSQVLVKLRERIGHTDTELWFGKSRLYVHNDAALITVEHPIVAAFIYENYNEHLRELLGLWGFVGAPKEDEAMPAIKWMDDLGLDPREVLGIESLEC